MRQTPALHLLPLLYRATVSPILSPGEILPTTILDYALWWNTSADVKIKDLCMSSIRLSCFLEHIDCMTLFPLLLVGLYWLNAARNYEASTPPQGRLSFRAALASQTDSSRVLT